MYNPSASIFILPRFSTSSKPTGLNRELWSRERGGGGGQGVEQ